MNPRPSDYKSDALPAELDRQGVSILYILFYKIKHIFQKVAFGVNYAIIPDVMIIKEIKMFFVFSKQFRTEEKIFSELAKKIKESKKIAQSWDGLAEVYKLDTIRIEFISATPAQILVYDKAGKEILSLDCEYNDADRMQQARSHWFSGVLADARKRYEKDTGKEKMRRASAKIKAQKEQERHETAMVKALDKIKSL